MSLHIKKKLFSSFCTISIQTRYLIPGASVIWKALTNYIHLAWSIRSQWLSLPFPSKDGWRFGLKHKKSMALSLLSSSLVRMDEDLTLKFRWLGNLPNVNIKVVWSRNYKLQIIIKINLLENYNKPFGTWWIGSI